MPRRATATNATRQWTGYMVHVSETCEPTAPHLLTHVHTTPATVHEAQCTEPIQQALVDKDVPPQEHLVDAAYISADVAGPKPRGPGHRAARAHPTGRSWQAQVEGAYTSRPICRSTGSSSRCTVRRAKRR